jgi:hypothetical protein
MPVGADGRRVLRWRDFADEGARGRSDLSGVVCGGVLAGLPDGVGLPLAARRGRRVGAPYTVGAGGSVTRRLHEAAGGGGQLRPGLGAVIRPGAVRFVRPGVAGVLFQRGFGAAAFGGRVLAVSGAVAGRRGDCLAAHVGADCGGEYATPAAQDECPDETKIDQLRRHVFFSFARLIYTGRGGLSMRGGASAEGSERGVRRRQPARSNHGSAAGPAEAVWPPTVWMLRPAVRFERLTATTLPAPRQGATARLNRVVLHGPCSLRRASRYLAAFGFDSSQRGGCAPLARRSSPRPTAPRTRRMFS